MRGDGFDPRFHRKTIKHFNESGHAHELTFSCYLRQPLLNDDGRRRLLSEAIDRATASHHFDLLAFIYMPEHVHALVRPATDDADVSALLYAIKRPFSFRVKQTLERDNDPLLQKLRVRERPGKFVFRFWQEGPGFDRNLWTPDALIDAANYIHDNPVRRGLCQKPEDWKWSSWKAIHSPEPTPDPDLPVVHSWPF